MKIYPAAWMPLLLLLPLSGCEPAIADLPFTEQPEATSPSPDRQEDALAEGYFEVCFRPGYEGMTRGAVSGTDGRVRQLRYLVYNSAGNFVKEKILLKPSDPVATWPLRVVRDTLPYGQYTAVFLANTDKTQFPYPGAGGATQYADVLTNYTASITYARIVLPSAEFTDTSEYYWAKVSFSDATPQPTVLLQRIIGLLNLHRNFVDAETALNQLVHNIVTQINYKNTIQTTVNNLLPAAIKNALDLGILGNVLYKTIGGLDIAIDQTVKALTTPIVNALYDLLLQQLINQIGLALTGNATQQGALSGVGVLLNPWAMNEAQTAIVTLRNFPKTMDFNLTVKDFYTGDQRFKFTFTPASVYDEKDILIKGLTGTYDVRKINVIKTGLVSGLVVDQLIDSSFLLNGTFIDINDPIQAAVASNRRYQADYSFIDLRLKSYTQQTDGNHSLTLQVKLANIADIDNILGNIPLVGPLLTAVLLGNLKKISLSVPINLPLLGVDNLELSGGWSTPTAY